MGPTAGALHRAADELLVRHGPAILVFMVFVVRGMRVALQAQDGFSKLLAAGLAFGFALQALVITSEASSGSSR